MLAEKKKKPPVKHVANVYRTTSRADADVRTEIDLRGQLVDEAIANLNLYIDKCVLNSISEIRIIHGKGTGALRSAVKAELKTAIRSGAASVTAAFSIELLSIPTK